MALSEVDFKKMAKPEAMIVDLKGILRGKIKDLKYWSL
jgi:hypothetical protein